MSNLNHQKRHWTIEVTNLNGDIYTILDNYCGTYEEASAEVNLKAYQIENEIGLIFKLEFIAK